MKIVQVKYKGQDVSFIMYKGSRIDLSTTKLLEFFKNNNFTVNNMVDGMVLEITILESPSLSQEQINSATQAIIEVIGWVNQQFNVSLQLLDTSIVNEKLICFIGQTHISLHLLQLIHTTYEKLIHNIAQNHLNSPILQIGALTDEKFLHINKKEYITDTLVNINDYTKEKLLIKFNPNSVSHATTQFTSITQVLDKLIAFWNINTNLFDTSTSINVQSDINPVLIISYINPSAVNTNDIINTTTEINYLIIAIQSLDTWLQHTTLNIHSNTNTTLVQPITNSTITKTTFTLQDAVYLELNDLDWLYPYTSENFLHLGSIYNIEMGADNLLYLQ